MEVINYFLRYHSSTMNVMQRNARAEPHSNMLPKSPITGHSEVADDQTPENDPNNPVAACLLFAIFDCRHMATQGFWDAVIPYFYEYEHIENPWCRDLIVDRTVAFVQLPQSFTSLTIENDIFDMRTKQ